MRSGGMIVADQELHLALPQALTEPCGGLILGQGITNPLGGTHITRSPKKSGRFINAAIARSKTHMLIVACSAWLGGFTYLL